jgi:hypothetical protein
MQRQILRRATALAASAALAAGAGQTRHTARLGPRSLGALRYCMKYERAPRANSAGSIRTKNVGGCYLVATRPTNRRRSSMTEHSFHGINTSRPKKSEKCYPCVRYDLSPMSQAAHRPRRDFPEAAPKAAVFRAFCAVLLDHLAHPCGGRRCAPYDARRPLRSALNCRSACERANTCLFVAAHTGTNIWSSLLGGWSADTCLDYCDHCAALIWT